MGILVPPPALAVVDLYFLRTDSSAGVPPGLAESRAINSDLLINPPKNQGQTHVCSLAVPGRPWEVGCVHGVRWVPHCPHSIGRMKRTIDLIAVTVAPCIAGGIAVQNPGMQEAPCSFSCGHAGLRFPGVWGSWCFCAAGGPGEEENLINFSCV